MKKQFKYIISKYIFVVIIFCNLKLYSQGAVFVQHVCNDAKLDLQINGGFAPFEVLWQGYHNGTWEDISGWPKSNLDGSNGDEDLSGTLYYTKYKVIVTDDLCGTAEYELNVDPCKCINVNLVYKQNVSECSYPTYQTNTGAITISVNGTNDYSVSWSNGATGTSINKLITGYYTATITSGACQIIKTYLICCCGTPPGMQPPVAPVILCLEQGALEIVSENVNSPTTATSYDGSISIAVNGASSISWNGPNGYTGNGSNISGLGPGEYCAQIFDGCGNSIEKCYELVDCSLNEVVVNGTVSNTCEGYSYGIIRTTVLGGMEPYSYEWSNGNSGLEISYLEVGSYTLSVSDKNGCNAESTFSVDDSNSFVQDISDTNCGWNVSCNRNIVYSIPYEGDLDCYEIESCAHSRCFCPLNSIFMFDVMNKVYETYDFVNCRTERHCSNGSIEFENGHVFNILREVWVRGSDDGGKSWFYWTRCFELTVCSINGIDQTIDIVEIDVYACIGPPIPKNLPEKGEDKFGITSDLTKISKIEKFNSIDDLLITIYPIPLTDILTLVITGNIVDNFKFKFINSLGGQVFVSQIETSGENVFQFNTNTLKAGLYQVLLYDSKENIQTKSFIKI
ncbi:MAG: T9SS type A sorting domain-containing protein [Saprospiraceae bacterium]